MGWASDFYLQVLQFGELHVEQLEPEVLVTVFPPEVNPNRENCFVIFLLLHLGQ